MKEHQTSSNVCVLTGNKTLLVASLFKILSICNPVHWEPCNRSAFPFRSPFEFEREEHYEEQRKWWHHLPYCSDRSGQTPDQGTQNPRQAGSEWAKGWKVPEGAECWGPKHCHRGRMESIVKMVPPALAAETQVKVSYTNQEPLHWRRQAHGRQEARTKTQKDGPIQKRTENFYNEMGCKAEKQKERNTREIKMRL